MTDFAPSPAPGGDPAGGSDVRSQYEAALKGAQAAETPQARQRFVDQMASLAGQLPAAGSAPATDPGTGLPVTGPTEDAAFPAPTSALEYQLQTPPGVEIVDSTAAGAMKAAMFEAGIPTAFANEAFRSVAEMHAAGTFLDDRAYDAAVTQCRAAIVGKHGDAAPAMLRDAAAYLNRLAEQHPALEEAVACAMASPFCVAQAANLARHGTTRKR